MTEQDNAAVSSADPGLGELGPGTDTATPSAPPPPRAQESLRSENPPEQLRLGCLQVAGRALGRQVDTLESTEKKLQLESGASCFQQNQKHNLHVCLGHAGLRVHGAVRAEVIGRQLVPIRHAVAKSSWVQKGRGWLGGWSRRHSGIPAAMWEISSDLSALGHQSRGSGPDAQPIYVWVLDFHQESEK